MNQNFEQLLAEMAGGWSKIFMEKVYDKAFETDLAKRLQNLGIISKSAMISTLGLMSFYLTNRITEKNFSGRVFRQVTEDAWSEVGKRLLNGFHNLVVDLEKSAQTEEQKQVLQSLSQADLETLRKLLKEFIKTRTPVESEEKPVSGFRKDIQGTANLLHGHTQKLKTLRTGRK